MIWSISDWLLKYTAEKLSISECRLQIQENLKKKNVLVFIVLGSRPKIVIVVSTTVGLFLLSLVLFCIIWKKSANRGVQESTNKDIEIPLFDLATIAAATDNFSLANLIGEGGFGPVYKGNLSTGEEVAVKRLSKNSGQGIEQFMNEIDLLAKLRHRNLVGILGCCVQGEEKMLIYEYMSNKSLDYFIFDHQRRALLRWEKRFDIVLGIARGLLYRHQDSKLKIIHRDLKTSNVLLNSDLNPKISDFGLARILGGDNKKATTQRIVGTYGYMSPEYAFEGTISVKSDVFSLGVLMSEIVSEDRPAMSSVVFMFANEAAILPQPKQPGFFTSQNTSHENMNGTPVEESHTENDVTITSLDGR
ncbi:G-type lectin S-receptor-like serine/threonine-protein kinase SD1-1 [Hevea brasiliensis]|uniref:G-type lectin S-receptor-like serine/threonine-protein kinase SD1-1 n=1 Tax=Hevea brasiliensis TaxID=3981 RepID=UPI0025F50C47|nr:G-type lectin S-receptor-like serine/threonine-protein kinase SD1-1 [Hevea brasiliensis]